MMGMLRPLGERRELGSEAGQSSSGRGEGHSGGVVSACSDMMAAGAGGGSKQGAATFHVEDDNVTVKLSDLR